MHRSLPIALIAVACSMGDPALVVDSFAPDGAPAIQTAEAGPSVDHRGAGVGLTVGRLVPGASTVYTVSGLSAGELVHIARSTRGEGEGPCLGTLDGLCLDVRGPVAVHATGHADDGGVAALELTLPSHVPIGADVFFQAVVPRGATGLSWVKSDVVATVVEDATKPLALLVAGDLLITEVMAIPTAPMGEYVEVHNTSGVDVNLDGLRVATSTGDFEVAGTTYVEPGAYFVIGASADPALNGGVAVDLVWPEAVALADTWGEAVLMGAGLLDAVAWDDGAAWPLVVGSAMSVADGVDHLDNDLGENWCTDTDVLAGGDLGSPGAPSSCEVVVPPVGMSHTVEWGDHTYASLDDKPLDGTSIGCQETPMTMPAGWEIAPWVDGLDGMVNAQGWDTHCMLIEDGRSFSTFNHSAVPKDCTGACGVAADCLGQDGDQYWAISCSRRVLVRWAL